MDPAPYGLVCEQFFYLTFPTLVYKNNSTLIDRGMAQFSTQPDLAVVSTFIKEVTGCLCIPESAWSTWLPGDPTIIDECLHKIRSWYRPCHLKILNETEGGLHSNPCALIRQLLRPHGLTVLHRNKMWKIVRKLNGVCLTDAGNIVEWS